jgi:F0F1-type ATP synthase delta subunit
MCLSQITERTRSNVARKNHRAPGAMVTAAERLQDAQSARCFDALEPELLQEEIEAALKLDPQVRA